MEPILTEKNCFVYQAELMGIPPSETSLKRHQDQEEMIAAASQTGKTIIPVGCPICEKIIRGALVIGLTKSELDVFMDTFKNHQYNDLGRSPHYDEKTDKLNITALLDEIFEVASIFENPALSQYFLQSAYDEVQRRKVSHWVKPISFFNKQFKARLAITVKAEFLPDFIGLFRDRQAAEKAFKAAVTAGIIDEFGNSILGVGKIKSVIVQYWEAVSDPKFELTHLRARKEQITDTYLNQCAAIARQFGVTISKTSIYDNSGKRDGKYFTAVFRALNEQ